MHYPFSNIRTNLIVEICRNIKTFYLTEHAVVNGFRVCFL